MLVSVLAFLRRHYPLPKSIDSDEICKTSVCPKIKINFGKIRNGHTKLSNLHLL